MKKLTILALTLLLSSCTLTNPSSSVPSSSSSSEFTSSESSSSESSNSEPSPSESSSSESSSSEPSSSESSSSEEPPVGDYIFDFYNINDFHGHVAVEDTGDVSTYCPGISTIAGNLENFKAKNPEGYVFTNSGDMYQETYESYVTKGKVVSEMLDVMECEAMGLGNHEFDWGVDVLMENKAVLNRCNLLGANVYYYDEATNKVGEPATDLFEPYTIINRYGFNIGIIGVIGTGQITSITSSNWENLTFVDPTNVVLDYAKELKEEHDCRIVIVLGHGSFNDFGGYYGMNEKITKTFDGVTKYVDGVFLGHTHKKENKKLNNVPFLQSYGRGSQISHFRLNYNNGTGEVSCTLAENIDINIDSKIKSKAIDDIMDKYFDDDFYADANRVIGTFENSSKIINRTISGRFSAYASYEAIKELYPEVVLVGNNRGRADVNINDDLTVTKEMLFRMTPFTNLLCIGEVSGSDILSNFASGNAYYMPKDIEIKSNQKYQIAVIDYLFLHKGTNRKYNYFESLTSYETYNCYPCDISVDYLTKHGSIDVSFLAHDSGFSCLSY